MYPFNFFLLLPLHTAAVPEWWIAVRSLFMKRRQTHALVTVLTQLGAMTPSRRASSPLLGFIRNATHCWNSSEYTVHTRRDSDFKGGERKHLSWYEIYGKRRVPERAPRQGQVEREPIFRPTNFVGGVAKNHLRGFLCVCVLAVLSFMTHETSCDFDS